MATVTSDGNPFRAEIEQILLAHQRTRHAKVLDGMKRGLTDAEMSQEAEAAGEPCSADSIAAERRIVRLTLDDQLISAPSDAEWQAGVYRELLNYECSPGLRQHIITQLKKLQQIGPNVSLTPKADVRLGAHDASRPEKPVQICSDCQQDHAGECL